MAAGNHQTINTPRVLLTGASSQIGVFAIPRLVEAGFRVFAVSRQGKPANYPVYEQVEWLNEVDSKPASTTCRYLLSAGPMELAQKYLSCGTGIQAAIVFSSSSVNTKQQSRNSIERNQIKTMLALESELRLQSDKSGVRLLIFRTTLIYGCGLDTNISLLAKWIRRFGLMPVNGKAMGLRQPVHSDDLASAAITALLSRDTLPDMMYLAGGETLSYSEMVRRIFIALGKPVRLIRLPQWIFVMLIGFVNKVRSGSGVNAEMVRRQQLDLVFDDHPAREFLNYKPRPFEPDSADFSMPDI